MTDQRVKPEEGRVAARKPPTERQRRLGAELRKMRERAGLSLGEAATLHRVDKTTISNTESARFGVSPDRVRVWAANYKCPDQAYVDALADMSRERGPYWWDDYRDKLAPVALDLAEMEHHAVGLRNAQVTHMPGLLQREDYARAVFDEAVPTLTPADLDRKVEFRMRRREVLDRPEPPACTFLIHEAALRIRFGGAQVMRSQLEHLLKQSDRPNVTVRVVPFVVGGIPSAGSSALYACGLVHQLDTVQLDTPTASTFLHAETDLENYRAVLHRMEQRALGPDETRDFIRTALREM
jgi:transcriptional regulator with XRE-family HTH domain